MSEVRLIDANALISDCRICGNCKDYELCDGNIAFCPNAFARRAINEAPTVEGEPVRHGHFTRVKNTEGTPVYLECSRCGDRIFMMLTDPKYKFCPRCGAKMDRGKNK